jgi:DNA replication and repair protein RecF
MKLRSGGKDVTCDGEKVNRLADYLGRFPTVVFSSQDQLLVRGTPAVRRRWLDLTLATMDAAYLRAVQSYHRALTERNSLLKRGAPSDQLASFERPLAAAATELVEKRAIGVNVLSDYVAAAYAKISDSAEQATLAYAANAKGSSIAEWQALFHKNQTRDLALKATSIGPHRDDCDLLLNGKSAQDFGSEGQQRSLVIALRLAQVEFFRECAGVQPILLADDVLGELDPQRRRQFWDTLGAERQIIATGTRLPEADLGSWQVFDVSSGAFNLAPAIENVD